MINFVPKEVEKKRRIKNKNFSFQMNYVLEKKLNLEVQRWNNKLEYDNRTKLTRLIKEIVMQDSIKRKRKKYFSKAWFKLIEINLLSSFMNQTIKVFIIK